MRFSPQTWLIQDDFAAIAAAVQQGMGIAWLPDWLVAQALADGTLQQVLAPSAQVRSPSTRYGRRGRGCRKTRAAIDALRKGYLLPQHRLAQRNNRHLWRREVFRQRASYRRALRHSLSDEAVRHGRHGGTTCCGRYPVSAPPG